MYSPETIAAMADDAAIKAARVNATPYVPWDAKEVAGYGLQRAIPFPNIGSHRPQGWRLVEYETVDATGWDDTDAGGPALSVSDLRKWVTEHLTSGSGYAIIEVGQFQVVVGRFQKETGREPD